MVFYRINSVFPAARYLAGIIGRKLDEGKSVFWLVPGGSAIAVAVKVSQMLRNKNLRRLKISLTDERFVQPGHPDSNTRQLKGAGFDLPGAKVYPVLIGENIENTTSSFAQILESNLRNSDFKIGLFGMGADGHTAGIKPGSIAVESSRLSEHFEGEDFTRITMTPKAIGYLDEALLYATGDAKHLMLDKLEDDVEVATQPAQALKQVPRLTIFNDYRGRKYENSN